MQSDVVEMLLEELLAEETDEDIKVAETFLEVLVVVSFEVVLEVVEQVV